MRSLLGMLQILCRPSAVLTLVVALGVAACDRASAPTLRRAIGTAQGTTYSLQWQGGGSEREIAAAAERELERIDALLSTYRNDSVLERFNAAHTVEPQTVPAELVTLLGVAQRVHEASMACFDPTVRPLVRAWGFDDDTPSIPSPEQLEAARATVGLEHLNLIDGEHLQKTIPALEVDMSSIGQGYTAERLASVLEEHGSRAYLAEIGGEVVARGAKPDGAAWRIGVENPTDDNAPGPALRMPEALRAAVITSGSYRHYFEQNGQRFSHVIDPRTGQPVNHALLSVTVLGRDAALTAAWATALLCLGPERTAETTEHENVAALWWVQDGDSAVLHESAAFERDWPGVLE